MGDFKLYNTWYKSWISKFPIEENFVLARNSLLSDYTHWPSCGVTSSSSSSFIHTYLIAIQHICNTSHVDTDQVRSDKAHV